MNKFVAAGAVVLVGVGLYFAMQDPNADLKPAEFIMPDLSDLAKEGQVAFEGTCAACHGVNLDGTDNGPPLLHALYAKARHADFGFVMAVQRGSRAHHWRFGDMPAQPHITDEELEAIITYVRVVQAANGF